MATKHQRGFTLLEVMVAVAVLAVALGALIKGSAETTANTAYLYQRSIATWVAANKVSELRLEPKLADKGEKRGKTEMAGHEWHWLSIVKETQSGDLRRLDVEVRLNRDDQSPMVSLTSFILNPALQAAEPPAVTGLPTAIDPTNPGNNTTIR